MATYYDYEKNFDTQSNYGWGLSFNMTGKVPAIHKRIFDTLEGAQAFADNYDDSAIPGLLLSIINDENEKNNGVYFIKKIKSNETDTSAELVKLGIDISEIEEKINTLIGEDNNKSVRTIANEELVKQLIPEDAAESLDTLQEIAQWIQEHPSDAAEMNRQIVELTEAKSSIDEYTVNDKKISENPVLDTTDLKVNENYTSINQQFENVVPGDILTTAISKIEVMLANTTLALTAAISDLDKRIGVPTEYDDDGNIVKEGTGLYRKYEEIYEIINNIN